MPFKALDIKILDLVIQIVNYKTKKYLTDCVDSVIHDLENTNISYKILILDNNSGDDFRDLEEKYKQEKVEFHYSDKNLGFGGGHNFLVKKQISKYLFIFNPDTITEKGAIKTLFDFMEEHQESGMCGPRVLLPEKIFFWHKNIFWPKQFVFKEFFERFFKIKIFKKVNYLEFDPIVGSALFVRREAFEKVRGFDENLFLYFEERDLCNSLKKEGYKIFFVYDAVITHFYGKSDSSKKEKVEYFKQSRRYFYKKWYGKKKQIKMLEKEESPSNDRHLEKVL